MDPSHSNMGLAAAEAFVQLPKPLIHGHRCIPDSRWLGRAQTSPACLSRVLQMSPATSRGAHAAGRRGPRLQNLVGASRIHQLVNALALLLITLRNPTERTGIAAPARGKTSDRVSRQYSMLYTAVPSMPHYMGRSALLGPSHQLASTRIWPRIGCVGGG